MRNGLIDCALFAREPDNHRIIVKVLVHKSFALNKIDTETKFSENRGILFYVVITVNKFKYVPIFIACLIRESRKSCVKTFKTVDYKDLCSVRSMYCSGDSTREGVAACIVGDNTEICRRSLFRLESVTQHVADIDAVIECKTVGTRLHDVARCGISEITFSIDLGSTP